MTISIARLDAGDIRKGDSISNAVGESGEVEEGRRDEGEASQTLT